MVGCSSLNIQRKESGEIARLAGAIVRVRVF